MAEDQYLAYFRYDHLKYAEPRAASVLFHDLACALVQMRPGAAAGEIDEQWKIGMQRLLEAKDCMVRVALANRTR